MKRIFYALALILVSALAASCEQEQGTMPGNDSAAGFAVFTFAPDAPYVSDNDLRVKICPNNKVTDVYYVAEPKDKAGTDDAYIDHVISAGTHLSVQGDVEQVVTGMMGDYVISFVAVDASGNRKLVQKDFTGIIWEDVVTGTYSFKNANIQKYIGGATAKVLLQKSSNVANLYRVKDLYGKGYSLKFTLVPDIDTSDSEGPAVACTVAPQKTGFTFTYKGEDQPIQVRDVATWQNNEDYLSSMYFYTQDNHFYLWVQYYIAAGNLGYGYDSFSPDE